MSFKDIINQQKAKDLIAGQLASGRVPHAYLFLGPDGVGRKKTALELAKALNCQKNATGDRPQPEPCDHCISCQKIDHGNHPDVRLIDFAWQAARKGEELEKQKSLKIETIRALQYEIGLKASEGRWKVFLVEPAEKITLDAANCLLKTLEEPPKGTVIVLIARHRDTLPATIVSRTQIIPFRPLPEAEVVRFLETRHSLAPDRAAAVAREAEGSLSWAVSRLGGDVPEAEELWARLRDTDLARADLLEISKKNAKTPQEFLTDLLGQAKTDFRDDPVRFRAAVEQIIAAQGLILQNISAQLTLDTLLMKLHKTLRNR